MRVRSTPLLAAVVCLTASMALTAQVSLKDLPEVARQRAERLRPIQLAALQPFWADFALEYRNNQEVLDEAILAGTVLDWQPTVSLDDGLKKTISYFEEIIR